MAERDYAEELLESANAFFEEHEATEVIRKFLESDQVGNIVDNAYNEMKKTIGGYVEGAPEDLMEKAKELEEMFCGDEAKEHFQKDFKANFKRRLAGTLDVLPEFIKSRFYKTRSE